MIKSISIQNFQSHVHTDLQFVDGVNCIVGSSDCGKTAIIRALRWAVTNRPSGDSIRSNWGGDTLCLVETEEGAVLRFKGKEDRYEVKIGEQRSIVLKAFGTNVPAEVAAFFNLNEINVQSQLDAPFLLSESAGAVAAHFNKVAKLDRIDSATSNVNGWIRELTASARFKEGELEKLQGQLTEFDYIDKFEAELEVLEELQNNRIGLESARKRLAGSVKQLKQTKSSITELQSGVLSIEDEVNAVVDLIDGRDATDTMRDRLSDAITNLKRIDRRIAGREALVALEIPVFAVLNKRDVREAKAQQINKLDSLCGLLRDIEEDIGKLHMKLKKNEERFQEEMPETCSLCGQYVEKWKPIIGYENLYEISSIGRIRSYYTNAKNIGNTVKIKEQSTDKDGYKRVSLYDATKPVSTKNVAIHRLVLQTFIGPCPPGMEASHLDGDKTNNRLDNLKWESHYDNEQHKQEHGTRKKGIESALFKLSFEEIEEIRELYIPYKMSQSKLAEKYNVCEDTIRKVLKMKIKEME